MLIALPLVVLQVNPNSFTGSGPWEAPSPEILYEPRVPDRKPPELARWHSVLRKVGLDLIQKLHQRPTHFRLVFLLCSV